MKGVRELEEDEGTKGEGVDEGKSSIESQKSQGAVDQKPVKIKNKSRGGGK